MGTVAGPLIGGFLFLITKETPFYVFSFFALIAAFGIYSTLEPTNPKRNEEKSLNKIKWTSSTVLPFLAFAAILSLFQASLIQSIGFYITDLFGYFQDLPTLISMTFA